jgi:hypothetical protein
VHNLSSGKTLGYVLKGGVQAFVGDFLCFNKIKVGTCLFTSKKQKNTNAS